MAKRRRRQQIAVGASGQILAAGQRVAFRAGDDDAILYELPPTYARRPGTFDAAEEGEESTEPCGCVSRVAGGRWRLVHLCGKR